MSLRLRFFIVVWALLVVGLVGLGTLLGRWSTVEIRRVTAEARVDRMLTAADGDLTELVLRAPEDDSVALSTLLAERVAADSLLLGAAIIDGSGRVRASALPEMAPGGFVGQPDGEFEWRREEASDGHQATIRLVGTGRLIDPRDSLDPRYLVVLPAIHTDRLTSNRTPQASTALLGRVRWALVIGSILAALVTFAISGPLLGRVGELVRATSRLGRGDLAARVPVQGSDEIAQLGASFNAMAGDLQRSEEQRRQMVTDVAHELRTPLTNITGLLEAVEDGLRVPDAELIAVLQEEAGLLTRLVDDLRDLSLAEAGELVVSLEPVEVAAVVDAAVASFGMDHGIVCARPAGEHVTQADPRRLGQVVRNLLRNALTHSPVVGSVSIAVTSGADGVRIVVSDQGNGIPAGELDRIWERFYRVDRSRDRATGGMGLGLPVSRRLVEAMGGTITVESRVGEGTTFVVAFTVAAPLPDHPVSVHRHGLTSG
ncbi:MAG TPA: ATP-binding protein [Gemmatimonadales bacterium]|nr:ATP-binding protein [Gemmatimonadales bacterium]